MAVTMARESRISLGVKCSESVVVKQDSVFSVCGRAFLVAPSQPENTTQAPPSQLECNLLFCILQYNYGLCRHLVGVARKEESAVEEALESYVSAQELLNSLSFPGPLTIILDLALSNNQSHIYHHYIQDRVPLYSSLNRTKLLMNQIFSLYGSVESGTIVCAAYNMMAAVGFYGQRLAAVA